VRAGGTLGEALALLRPARPRRARAGATTGGGSLRGVRRRKVDCRHLPDEPGIYVFRNEAGQPLYVGKSVGIRARARAHFAASSPDGAWVMQAETVEGETTASELGALLLEHETIRRLGPPGNVRHKHEDRYVFLRCRLDIPFPILEVAGEPAAGRAVNVGPLQGRHAAVELMEQLNSLFGLRHCGRALPRHPRQWPSAYGQMGRCLSPCLGDLDPNLYRRRLDEALGLLDGGAGALLGHLDAQMRAAAAEHRYERAGWLRRRRERLDVLLERLGGVVEATHSHPVSSSPSTRTAAAPTRSGSWAGGWRTGARPSTRSTSPPAPPRRCGPTRRRGGRGTSRLTRWPRPASHDVDRGERAAVPAAAAGAVRRRARRLPGACGGPRPRCRRLSAPGARTDAPRKGGSTS
jgi:DNA polymerase-3 subunit epsilon